MTLKVKNESKKSKKEAKSQKKQDDIKGADNIGELAEVINKQYGQGAFRKLGDESVISTPAIPTGCIKLDRALGIGGFPRGRIVEIFGPEASGKTTLLLQAIATAQKMGGNAAVVDAEHALDLTYCKRLGINTDELWIAQPDTGEEALGIVDYIVRSGKFSICGIDSVAALTPKAELDGEMGDSHVGLQARLMSQALRKLTSSVARSKTCVIFINQIRSKIGVMFGSPETTTGGNALKFYSSVRIDIRRIGSVKSGNDNIGNQVKVKVVKNKLAPPFKTIESEIIFGTGFNTAGDVIDEAVAEDVIEKSGSWFSYNGERLGQGRVAVCEALNSNKELLDQIVADLEMERE